MLIYAYVDENYNIHIDPTITINSNSEGAYTVKYIFQQPWSSNFTLYGVFKPVNDIPISFQCDENNEVSIPPLAYGRYKRLGIGLKGISYGSTTNTEVKTSVKQFSKNDFTQTNESEYTYTINKVDLELSNPQLLNICIFTDSQQTILEPVDYGVKYTDTQVLITLNIPLNTYTSYNGVINFIDVGNDSSNTNQERTTVVTNYYYVPVDLGAIG